MECGIITFVPLPPSDVNQGPIWTCILVDDDFRDRAFAKTPDGKQITYRVRTPAVTHYRLTSFADMAFLYTTGNPREPVDIP